MLWVYLTLFAILNVYCLIYFHQVNKELKKEITLTKNWCKDTIEDLIEQEGKIDELLIQVIKDINDNKLTTDVIGLVNSDSMCEHHMQVYNDMKDEQARLSNKILNIKKEHSDIVSNAKDRFEKFENYPGDE